MAGISGGLGFMTKGPAALAMPALAWIAFAISTRGHWKRIFSPSVLPGLLAFVLVALPWYVAIMLAGKTNSAAENQIESELTVMLAESHHAGSPFYYVYTLVQALAPWGLLLPAAIVLSIRRARHHSGIRFTLAWLLTAFVTLTLISSKQIHYATLLVAPSVLLMGWFMGFGFSRVSSWRKLFCCGYVVVLLSVFLLAGLCLVTHVGLPPDWPRAASRAYGMIMIVLSLGGLLMRGMLEVRIIFAVLALSSVVALYAGHVDRVHKKHAIFPEFLRETQSALIGAPRVFMAGPFSSIIEFYMLRPMIPIDSVDNARKRARPGDLILATGNPRHPLAVQNVQLSPILSRQREGIEIALFAKVDKTP